MNSVQSNIYRQKKYNWTPLLSFGGGITRDTTSDGWHGNPYGAPGSRTMGLRYKDGGLPVPPDPVSKWELEETSGNIFYDSVGSNHGTDPNIPSLTTPALVGKGFDWGLTRPASTIPHSQDFIFNDGTQNLPFSFSFWVYRTGGGSLIRFIDKSNQMFMGIVQNLIRLEYRDNNNVQHARAATNLDNNGGVPVNTWTHLAFTFDPSSQVRIYKNGYEINTSGNTSAPIRTNINPDIKIGGPSFSGPMDQILYYKRVLTDKEVVSLYNNGKGITEGIVKSHQVAFRSDIYDTYDTQAGFTMDVKFDVSKLTSIWYRYRFVDGILQPFSNMPNLRVLSLREHNTHFGHLDLSLCPKFSHLDTSTHWSTESYLGGSIDQITFHPDAPLKFVYLSGCVIPTSVVDACLTQCYNHRDTPAPDGIEDSRQFQSQRVSWSPGLQYMVDELKNNYGWAGFSFY